MTGEIVTNPAQLLIDNLIPQAVTPAIPMPEEEELNMKFAELVVRTKQRLFSLWAV